MSGRSPKQILQRAVALHREGRLQDAEDLYREILNEMPQQPEALHLLGVLHHQRGDSETAVDLITQAIAHRPDFADAHANLGNACLKLNRLEEALASFRRAIGLNPASAESHYNLGRAWQQKGEVDEAMAAYQAAIERDPGHARAHNNLGTLYRALNRPEDALASYQRAVEASPGYAEAHLNLGHLMKDLGRVPEARGQYRKAVELDPEIADGHLHLGLLWSAEGMHIQAVESYGKAIACRADYGEAHYNLGHALMATGRPGDAIASYLEAIRLNPEVPEIHYNLGNAHVEQGDLASAVRCFEAAIERRPDYRQAHQNLANAHLMAGDLKRGYGLYNWRWQGGEKSAYKWRPFPQPRWDGTSLDGKSILVWAEQGLGDEIVFASFYRHLTAHARRCYFEVEPRLVTLFQRSFPSAVVVARSDPPAPRLMADEIDFQAPAGDLMQWLMPDFDAGPERETYLVADPAQTKTLRRRYRGAERPLVVGLGWQTVHPTVQQRNSVPLEAFDELLAVSGVCFVNLQYGDHRAALAAARRRTGTDIRDDDIDPLTDIDGFAAQVSSMDLVISIVNSTAVMASALGVPVWGVVPPVTDWRWGNDGDHCLWYPSMRLFRPPVAGDWKAVFANIARDLEAVGADRNILRNAT